MRQVLAAAMQSRTPISNSAPDDGGQGGQGGGGDTGGGGSSEGGGGGGSTIQGGGGADNVSWFDTLADDVKGLPSITRHKTLPDFVAAALAAEKRLGVPADRLLKVPEKPEEMDGFARDVFKRLGAPDNADGYKLDLGADANDDDKAMGAAFAKHMFEKTGVHGPVLQAAVDFWNAQTKTAAEAEAAADTAAQKAAETALRAEYGAAYDQTFKDVGQLLTNIGGKELVDELDLNTQVGSNPKLFQFLAKISAKMAEAGPKGDGGSADTGNKPLTPAEARFQRLALESDPVKGKALRDGAHAMHASVVEERNKLLRFENPPKQDA